MFGPDLRVVIARELTKVHEEFLRGTVRDVRRELAGRDRVRGEITLLVQAPASRQRVPTETNKTLAERVAALQAEAGRGREGSAEAAGARTGAVEERAVSRAAAGAGAISDAFPVGFLSAVRGCVPPKA